MRIRAHRQQYEITHDELKELIEWTNGDLQSMSFTARLPASLLRTRILQLNLYEFYAGKRDRLESGRLFYYMEAFRKSRYDLTEFSGRMGVSRTAGRDMLTKATSTYIKTYAIHLYPIPENIVQLKSCIYLIFAEADQDMVSDTIRNLGRLKRLLKVRGDREYKGMVDYIESYLYKKKEYLANVDKQISQSSGLAQFKGGESEDSGNNRGGIKQGREGRKANAKGIKGRRARRVGRRAKTQQE